MALVPSRRCLALLALVAGTSLVFAAGDPPSTLEPPAVPANPLFNQLSQVAPAPPSQEAATPPPARNERALFELARSYFEERSTDLAAGTLSDFLRLYPKSQLAAEARYRLLMCDRLRDRKPEAEKQFHALLEEHPASAWTEVMLWSAADEEGLRKLANEWRTKAAQPDGKRSAALAVRMFEVYATRFTASPGGPAPQAQSPERMSATEAIYKRGVCRLQAGDEVGFRKDMEAARAGDAKDSWAKLAAFRLADRAEFLNWWERLGELPYGADAARAILAALDRFQPEIEEARWPAFVAYRATCWQILERDEEMRDLLERVARDYPDAPEAPAALLRLAEHYYHRKDLARAAREYERFLERYPGSPDADAVRRWVSWLEDHDDCCTALEGVLDRWRTQMQSYRGGVACRLTVRCPQLGLALEGRCAFDAQRCLLDLQGPRGSRILVARTPEAFVLHHPLDDVYVQGKGEDLPIASLYVRDDVEARSFEFGLLADADTTQPTRHVELSPRLPSYLVSWLASESHLSREVRRNWWGRTTVVYHAQDGADDKAVVYEVETDGAGGLLRLEAHYGDLATGGSVLRIDGLQFQDVLPASAFAFEIPEGARVEDNRDGSALAWFVKLASQLNNVFRSLASHTG